MFLRTIAVLLLAASGASHAKNFPSNALSAAERAPAVSVVIAGNTNPIVINDNAAAALYPSIATITGVTPSITRVRVQLTGLTHTFPDDLDIILEGPQGQRAMLMSNAGGGADVSGINLTFDPTAATVLPDTSPLALTTATIAALGKGDLIAFSTLSNTPETISLQIALTALSESLTINGPGADLLTVQCAFNAATEFRIFAIPGGIPQMDIRGITISNCNAGSVIFGCGIDRLSKSLLTNVYVTNVHVTGNQADGGGGAINFLGSGGGTLRALNSTISGKTSANRVGGIFDASSGSNSRLEVTNSTIAGNTAPNGGGISTFTQIGLGNTATTTLRNAITAGNSPTDLTNSAFNGGAFETIRPRGNF